jgi:hypothetical protein
MNLRLIAQKVGPAYQTITSGDGSFIYLVAELDNKIPANLREL